RGLQQWEGARMHFREHGVAQRVIFESGEESRSSFGFHVLGIPFGFRDRRAARADDKVAKVRPPRHYEKAPDRKSLDKFLDQSPAAA
ncbi:MAG TPA: hypothetical protein PLG99_12085, partial [Kaistiaceae bacterium]|nr:hypothetical protein [Kaistiaceae bacterium]